MILIFLIITFNIIRFLIIINIIRQCSYRYYLVKSLLSILFITIVIFVCCYHIRIVSIILLSHLIYIFIMIAYYFIVITINSITNSINAISIIVPLSSPVPSRLHRCYYLHRHQFLSFVPAKRSLWNAKKFPGKSRKPADHSLVVSQRPVVRSVLCPPRVTVQDAVAFLHRPPAAPETRVAINLLPVTLGLSPLGRARRRGCGRAGERVFRLGRGAREAEG